MRKNLFLTCALALASSVGVSAQDWSHTLAQGLPGTQITHDVNGTSVTQYRAVTKLFEHPGTNGVRYTVLETGTSNQIKGGGPCWAMAEMIVLDAAGDTVGYTVTSNADHNTMGNAGTDGAGMPGLNDGNLNNFFHSTWSDAAPMEYHYIELTFENPVDAFQLIWYTRPNQHVNKPQLVGLSPLGVEFTEPYGEYQFQLGEQVNSLSALAEGDGLFTFYVENQETYPNADGGDDYTGPGSIYVALSGYDAGDAVDASPKNIMQLIPGNEENTYVIYQPILGTYWGNSDNWTDGWGGSNGWQRASDIASRLGEFTFSLRPDGQFEISCELKKQYVNNAWEALDEPLKVYVGYELRGNLKLFTAEDKALIESGDLDAGSFHLPVDFGFQLNRASVAEGTVEPISVDAICENVINPAIEQAQEKLTEYAEWDEYDWEGAKDVLEEALQAAQDAIAENNIAGIFAAKDELTAATIAYVAQKANYYDELYQGLEAECNANYTEDFTEANVGKYTPASKSILENAQSQISDVLSLYDTMTISQIEAIYEALEAAVEQFKNSTLKFSTFPTIYENISDATHSTYTSNAVWKSPEIVTGQKLEGVRLTPLSVYIGSAGSGGLFGGYPMVALGELKVYDGQGNEVELTEANVFASHTEVNEGFESTAARLVDGAWGVGDEVGTTDKATGSYFHSPWGGTAPNEYVYIEVTFPEPLDAFTVELYSRDKNTTGGQVSLFPFKLAVSALGQKYDPQLFAANPYNVKVGEQVTDAAQIEDGLYVIQGLINTHPVWNVGEDGNPTGVAKFYAGANAFHESADAVRANCVYRITKNADGTYSLLSLSAAKYWPTVDERTSPVALTANKTNAAKINIVASNNIENAFVLYENHPDLEMTDSIDSDEDGVNDAANVTKTPYVVYMDWGNLAARPVINPQPRHEINDTISEGRGEELYFNKGSGEGEWAIYKVATMDNPDFYWLTNMVGIVEGLGIEVGEDPGCVASLGDLQAAYDVAQAVVADSAYDQATAAAVALSEKIALAESLEKNPMVPGYYIIRSGYAEYLKQQGHNKAVYVSADGSSLRWGKEENNVLFYFDFQPSPDRASMVDDGTLTEEQAEQLYTIRAVGVNEPYEYYIGESDAQSTQIDLSDWYSNYLVKPSTGSNFNLANPYDPSKFCLHTNGHGSGAGAGSNLVYWTGDPGASQWRLVKVDYTPTSIEDLVVEGDEVVSVSYFTTAGAALPAPAKGVNVVVTVYANGVVETKKVIVK